MRECCIIQSSSSPTNGVGLRRPLLKWSHPASVAGTGLQVGHYLAALFGTAGRLDRRVARLTKTAPRIKTTMIYADYQASDQEHELVQRAFAGTNPGTNLSATEDNSEQQAAPRNA